MSKKIDLNSFYYNNLSATLKGLEDRRKKLRDRIIVGFIMLFCVAFMVGIKYDIVLLTLFFSIIISAITYGYITKNYISDFKQSIIKPLIAQIDESLLHLCDSFIPEQTYNNSALFQSANRYSGNDLIKGNIDGVDVEFSQIHAESEHIDRDGKRSYSTIFKGLFFIAKFNKSFKGRTLVLPDRIEGIFGNNIAHFLQSKNFSKDELVKMDDVEFEKKFVVYASSQIEARYILSHSLMKNITNLSNKTKRNIHISFVNSHIYIAISYANEIFRPTIFKSLFDFSVAREYIEVLALLANITKELKLNQKLWL